MTSSLLGMDAHGSLPPSRVSFRYRHPRSFEGFNTSNEFLEIEQRIRSQEKRQVQKLVNNLSSLLVGINKT